MRPDWLVGAGTLVGVAAGMGVLLGAAVGATTADSAGAGVLLGAAVGATTACSAELQPASRPVAAANLRKRRLEIGREPCGDPLRFMSSYLHSE